MPKTSTRPDSPEPASGRLPRPPAPRRPPPAFGGGPPPPTREPLVSNAVLGTLIFVICEVMFFAGMISAFLIVKGAALGDWPPAGQPRLPIEETALNTAALLLSGVLIALAQRSASAGRSPARQLLGGIALGAFFVGFQGFEWLGLIREGLTLTSSNHGSFFYLIVGTHAAHAVAALVALLACFVLLQGGRLRPSTFHASQTFWYFLVGLWPVLYGLVYL